MPQLSQKCLLCQMRWSQNEEIGKTGFLYCVFSNQYKFPRKQEWVRYWTVRVRLPQYALTTNRLLTLPHCRSPWTKNLFLCLSSTASCGLRQHRARQYRIKVGSYADIEAHPWQAAIFVKYRRAPGEHFLCGGILISSCWVLSAAHCFEEGWVEDLVLFGKSWY